MSERELSLKLPLEDKSRDELMTEGLQRLGADDHEHPAARFFLQENLRQQLAHEGAMHEQRMGIPSERAMQLVLFSAQAS